MAEKIAPGVWLEDDAKGSSADAQRQQTIDKFVAKRDNARWSAVVGFAMLFAASFSTAFAIGGVLMIAYGAGGSIFWSRRLSKFKGDPWAYDPELDGPNRGFGNQ